MRQVSVLSSFAIVVALAACARPGAPSTTPFAPTIRNHASHPGTAASYAVIYRFGERVRDGAFPYASVIEVGGKLYGTTQDGGLARCNTGQHSIGCGTIYEVTPSGAETVLHRFGDPRDGWWPQGTLVNVNGTLYGATPNGGAYGQGAIFALNPATGKERVVYSFNGTDGDGPYAGLIDDGGILYGTASLGGAHSGFGVVFSLDPSTGTERVLYDFKGGRDGDTPVASLTAVDGNLFGTTYAGGSGCGSLGCGTVFTVNERTGVERVLYRFAGGSDGSAPYAGVTYVNGMLYGTTSSGGAACGGGCGTAFSIDPKTGAETVIHAFAGGADGSAPLANLTDVRGTLYGTTLDGGLTSPSQKSSGTIFSIATTGTETVLYRFSSVSNGSRPQAELTYANGKLYGTTGTGGAGDLKGTVFAFTP